MTAPLKEPMLARSSSGGRSPGRPTTTLQGVKSFAQRPPVPSSLSKPSSFMHRGESNHTSPNLSPKGIKNSRSAGTLSPRSLHSRRAMLPNENSQFETTALKNVAWSSVHGPKLSPKPKSTTRKTTRKMPYLREPSKSRHLGAKPDNDEQADGIFR